MKKNHDQVESTIRAALKACGDDYVFADAKRHLTAALRAVQSVAAKRKRLAATQEANAKAEKVKRDKHAEWWKMIQENATKNINLENDNGN